MKTIYFVGAHHGHEVHEMKIYMDKTAGRWIRKGQAAFENAGGSITIRCLPHNLDSMRHSHDFEIKWLRGYEDKGPEYIDNLRAMEQMQASRSGKKPPLCTKFRHRALVVDAMQFDGHNALKIYSWAEEVANVSPSMHVHRNQLVVDGPDGGKITAGDWVVCTEVDMFVTMSHHDFTRLYEPEGRTR